MFIIKFRKNRVWEKWFRFQKPILLLYGISKLYKNTAHTQDEEEEFIVIINTATPGKNYTTPYTPTTILLWLLNYQYNKIINYYTQFLDKKYIPKRLRVKKFDKIQKRTKHTKINSRSFWNTNLMSFFESFFSNSCKSRRFQSRNNFLSFFWFCWEQLKKTRVWKKMFKSWRRITR